VARSKAGVVVVVVMVAIAGIAVWGLPRLWESAKSQFASDTCTIGAYDLDPSQASVAAAMIGAATKFTPRLPAHAGVLALAAALQESKLTNIAPGSGDRDSVGVLQQRPSQDWGKIAGLPDSIAARTQRLTDVGEATREFLAKLVQVPNWQTLPLADAIQAVQISADGSAYAQHEPEATVLAAALRGATPAAITCDFSAPTQVAPPATVAALARKELGITTPVAVGSTVRVPGAGWQTTAWLVANADRLGIESVAYSGRQWTRTGGWKKSTASEAVVVATMHQLKKS
jgi:hypothetical protein